MATLCNVLTPGGPGSRVQPRNQGMGYLERGGDHWGEDLRASEWNTPGDRFYAPCSYRVIWTGWLNGTPGARIPWHSGLAMWLYLGDWGGDDMYMLITHCRSIKVRPGETGNAGDLLGTMGGSGWRDGPDWDRFIDHGHLGIAQNTTRPTGPLRNGAGWIDPLRWFARHGVDFDTTPTAAAAHRPATITPASTEPEGDLTVTQIDDLMKRLDRIEKKLDDGVPVDLTKTTAWRVIDGKQEATTASRAVQEVHGLTFESARAAGATEAALKEVLERPRENENKES